MSDLDPHSADGDRFFAEQLASIASDAFDMGKAEIEVREVCLSFWELAHRQRGIFAAAAEAISHLPKPVLESAEKTERLRASREALGVSSADEKLLSMMKARDILEELAREFG